MSYLIIIGIYFIGTVFSLVVMLYKIVAVSSVRSYGKGKVKVNLDLYSALS